MQLICADSSQGKALIIALTQTSTAIERLLQTGMRDQIKSLERRIWKAPAICLVSKKPCSHIISSKKVTWLSLINNINSPASVKSVCAAKKESV